MSNDTHTIRRAGHGALIARASVVAAGLATAVGLQFAGDGDVCAAQLAARKPSVVCAGDVNALFTAL